MGELYNEELKRKLDEHRRLFCDYEDVTGIPPVDIWREVEKRYSDDMGGMELDKMSIIRLLIPFQEPNPTAEINLGVCNMILQDMLIEYVASQNRIKAGRTKQV